MKLSEFNWSFSNEKPRQGRHGLHSYPATMHAPYVKATLESLKPSAVLDPFGGSGTVAVECATRNIRACSNDLNPLACIITEAKIAHYPIDFQKQVESFLADMQKAKNIYNSLIDTVAGLFPRTECGQKESEQDGILLPAILKCGIEVPQFKNISYWFRPEVIVSLKVIMDILPETAFFKVCFSECVRMVSNKRTGEFKMFRRPVKELLNYAPDVFATMSKVVNRNATLVMSNTISNCNVQITSDDARELQSVADNDFDLVLTSPPYGDSRTTVAYGQFSRLSLQWIMPDFPASQTDNLLLGGNRPKKFDLFGSVVDVVAKIEEKDSERAKHVAGFFCDLYKSFLAIDKKLQSKGQQVWVVANRLVRGERTPLDLFVKESGEKNGYICEGIYYREISGKTMPHRNSPSNQTGIMSDTMTQESIVVLEKK